MSVEAMKPMLHWVSIILLVHFVGTHASAPACFIPPWNSPTRIRSFNEVQECDKRFLSAQAYSSFWDPWNSTEPSITSLQQLEGIPRNRLFLYTPRHGLGNSLQAYGSTLVFSILSGRRLVIVLAGAHWRSLQVLCNAFECPRDFVRDGFQGVSIKHSFNRLKPEWLKYHIVNDTLAKLHDNSSLLYGTSHVKFDDFWLNSIKLRQCVLALFDCSTAWCVHSRALQYMIRGPPSSRVQAEIEENLVGEILGINNQTFYRSVRINHASQLRFDVSIHIRTVSRYLEGFTKCNRSNSEQCRETLKLEMEKEENLKKDFTSDVILNCISKFLKKIPCSENGCKNSDSTHWKEDLQFQPAGEEDSRQFPLNIFLATDNVGLRPIYVNFLKKYGWVHYSNWEVAHITKQGHMKGVTATIAEFFLLSRSGYLLAPVKGIKSTFGMSAAQLGNSTFIEMRFSKDSCRSRVIGKGSN